MFSFQLQHTSGNARTWQISTAHGDIHTPIFMPVGTRASVKWISGEDLESMWAEIILNNTYHLYLRPWDEVIQHFWGAHQFQSYHKPILSDSGGFQVFSLWSTREWDSLVKIQEDGVHFRSFIDGSKHFFSPEKVMDIQSNIGADIIMAFDECAPWESSKEYAIKAMERTHRWAQRSKEEWLKNNQLRKQKWLHEQALFWIVQWVIYDDLRQTSAKYISELDTPWISIGGLSVWESKEDMHRILDIMAEVLPKNKPRYLMGVWTPEDLVEWIYRGVDMFDCVLPTRLWRHGKVFWSYWSLNIKNKEHRLSDQPLDDISDSPICQNYSRWYLHHLMRENEMLGMSLLSYHNLYFLLELTRKARTAIEQGIYEEFRKNFWEKYSTTR